MRVALLTESGYPHGSDVPAWRDRLVHGLVEEEFEVYAIARTPRAPLDLPAGVRAVHTLPLYGPPPGDGGRVRRRRFLECYRELVRAVATATGSRSEGFSPLPAAASFDGSASSSCSAEMTACFAEGLYGLADLARESGGLSRALRSDAAIRALEAACRAQGADPLLGGARVGDLLAACEALERALRPLSAPWFAGDESAGTGGLVSADLCHATCAGPAALPGLLVRRWRGTPLLVTEYAVQLREHYLSRSGETSEDLCGPPVPVSALMAAFRRLLAGESYRQAAVITAGNAQIRRWQVRLGAPPLKIRTVHCGMDAGPLEDVGQAAEESTPDPGDLTLVWVGRPEPGKDLIGLLHAFAEIRKDLPGARLRIISTDGPSRPGDAGSPPYVAHCRSLAEQLFPDEAADSLSVGENPVSFWEVGSPYVPELADAYGSGAVVVLSSAVEDFPLTVVEAMFCGRAIVATDVGAVREVIGGTGLVVPPRNPRALAEACGKLLSDPERRARLGAVARARALELFTVEHNLRTFQEIYCDLAAHREPTAANQAAPSAAIATLRPATGPTVPGCPSRGPAWVRHDQEKW